MAATTDATQVVYELEGTLLEACSCGVLCPCWIGEDPDGGDVRRVQRLPLRPRHDPRRRRERPELRARRPHPGQRAHARELEAGRVRRRARVGRPAPGDPRRVRRQARRAARRPRRPDRRDARRGACRDHPRGPRRQGQAHDRRRRALRDAPVHRPGRVDDHTARLAVLDGPRARPPTSPSPTSTTCGCPSTAWSGRWRVATRSKPTTRSPHTETG